MNLGNAGRNDAVGPGRYRRPFTVKSPATQKLFPHAVV